VSRPSHISAGYANVSVQSGGHPVCTVWREAGTGSNRITCPGVLTADQRATGRVRRAALPRGR
jgi:hypothetical protein